MGYEMYRQLTYTIDDNPYDAFRKSDKKMKKTLSSAELANIERYRKISLLLSDRDTSMLVIAGQ